ncbi:MAG: LON peptidase substrate-binding domain-containing protein [Cyclobacteriaceae bacterium]|nr:LON peptidase substrate-binding domain-containing protein [Cyclobacteriaceae bacterium]
MFPLSLMPLPGELVPLHIFEPRYRQLLQDAETTDVTFGIHFNHEINVDKVGSLMRLESIIKRYPGGESDIIVKCIDVFTMDRLYRNFKNKLYPGGDVRQWEVDQAPIPGPHLYELFLMYQDLRNITEHSSLFNLYEVANELGLDLHDRYKFLTSPIEKRESFLVSRLKFQIHILQQEDKSKDVYHLN